MSGVRPGKRAEGGRGKGELKRLCSGPARAQRSGNRKDRENQRRRFRDRCRKEEPARVVAECREEEGFAVVGQRVALAGVAGSCRRSRRRSFGGGRRPGRGRRRGGRLRGRRGRVWPVRWRSQMPSSLAAVTPATPRCSAAWKSTSPLSLSCTPPKVSKRALPAPGARSPWWASIWRPSCVFEPNAR